MSTLHSFSTEAFPYTVGYVSELLGLNDAELDQYARMLGIAQQRDERTGKLIFFHRDVELLKRAAELVRAGEDIHDVAQRLLNGTPLSQPTPQAQRSSFAAQTQQQHNIGLQLAEPTASPYSPDNFPGNHQTTPVMTVPPPAIPKPINAPAPQASPQHHHNSASAMSSNNSSAVANRDTLAMMVETVSQVKEGILKDLSRMLDDKLSGLDEVVVQLIRAQSENELLKKRLDELQNNKDELERELSSFKPVQFGFYKKTR